MKQAPQKLGTDTGSVNNWVMSANQSTPEVGKGMTKLGWSDRTAYEVVHVSGDGKTIYVQEYNWKYETSYYDGDTILLDLKPAKYKLRYRYKNWWLMHDDEPISKWNVIFGTKRTYRDPHF